MRRAWVAAMLAAAVAVLTACSGPHSPSAAGGKALTLQGPDLVAIKKHSDIPNCPKVPGASVKGGMPSITLSCLGGGRAVDMAGLRGPLIVNFWASWCGSCREEMPALAAFAKSQSAVKVLGIDYVDAQPGPALELARRSDVAYPLVVDSKGALDRASPLPHISVLPMTFFLDAKGTITHIAPQAYTSEQDVAAAARQYLGTGG